MKQWYEHESADRVAVSGTSRGMIWLVAVIIFFALIGIAVWGFRVGTSDVRGQGDAQIIKNSAANRIAAQERFESLYAEIQSADRRLDQAAADKAAQPDNQTVATNYTGLANYCQTIVGDYNAEARKFRAEDFRSFDLPVQIDQTDRTVDCKESAA